LAGGDQGVTCGAGHHGLCVRRSPCAGK
jgi:hypothetical protein